MKFFDMLQMSAGNLWKRKLRTLLTILGVVIGVASIVVMVSLGLGLSKSMMDEYTSYGSMTQVRVQEVGMYGGDSSNAKHMDDEVIKELLNIEHVVDVYPVLDVSAISTYGAESAYLNIRGESLEGLRAEGIIVGEGTLPDESMDNLQFFYGCDVIEQYSNTKTGKGYWDTGVLSSIDFMKDPVFTVFDTASYYSSQNSNSENGTSTPPAKKYIIPACGVEETPASGYSMHGWYVYCDIEKLKDQLKQVFKNKPIPGQPTTKSGKPFKQIYYTQLFVEVDDMDNVMSVQQTINDMGFQGYSDAEMISAAQNTMGYVEAVLGGIGAVSLFVAAIGITNTMMMSIYERTKEIGVMKVLGCDMGNIRTLFLLEAAMIGFVGGIMGLALSYGVSAIINFVLSGASGDGGYILGFSASGMKLSTIPIWLSFLAVVFATVIAMIAGFFPSQKAMRLSPLAAIRNE